MLSATHDAPPGDPWWLHTGVLAAAVLTVMLAALLLVGQQQPLLAVVAIVAAIGALAVLGYPDLLTPIAVFMLYTNAAVIAVRFHGAPLVFGATPLLLLAVPAMRDVVLRGQKLIVTAPMALLFCFFVVQVAGALTSIRPSKAAQELVTWLVEALVLYLLVSNAIRTPKALRQAIWALLIAGAFVGGLSAFQQFTGSFDSNFGGFAQVSDASFSADGMASPDTRQSRLSGPIGEKNRYAQIMAVLLPIALFMYGAERARWLRLLALGSTLLTAIGFALAFSRGAAVGLALTFLVLLLMGYVKPSHLVLVVLAVIVTGLVVPQYAARLQSLSEVAGAVEPGGGAVSNTDGATKGRITEMAAAVLAFADHPVIGVGPGMFPLHYREYAEVVGGRVSTANRRSHSLYLGLAAEHGLLGLLTFGAIFFATFRGLNQARRHWRQQRPDLEKMATGLEAALVAFLTTSIFLHFAYIRYMWLVMGLAGAASHLARTEAADPASLASNAQARDGLRGGELPAR